MHNVQFLKQEINNPDSFRQCFNNSFNRTMEAEEWGKLWEWRFGANSSYSQAIGAYIVDGINVVCFVGCSPLWVLTPGNKRLKSGLLFMGMTRPDFQGKGLYLQTYKALRTELLGQGYELLITYDNHNSHYPEVTKLGFKDIGLLTNFSLDCSRFILPGTNSLRVKQIDIEAELLPILGQAIVEKEMFKIEGSSDYLKWRLLDCPLESYRCLGIFDELKLQMAIVYKIYNRIEIDWMDIYYFDENCYRYKNAFQAALGFFKDKQVHKVNLWSNLFTKEHLILESIGFEEERFSFYYLADVLNSDLKVDELKNWSYRFIDHDGY